MRIQEKEKEIMHSKLFERMPTKRQTSKTKNHQGKAKQIKLRKYFFDTSGILFLTTLMIWI